MTDQDAAPLERAVLPNEIDVGKPVEWMVDPARYDIVLGVTYVFSETGERKTVWYTSNKRRPKSFTVITKLIGDP